MSTTIARTAIADAFGAVSETLTLRFFVPGKPQPGGSKRAFVRPGMKFASIVDANPKAADWKRTVTHFAAQEFQGAPLLKGPLKVSCTFTVSRPQGHFGSGKNAARLKDSAPSHPTSKPDATKLWRSTEDALTGILFKDDAQIVEQTIRKVYGEKPGALIEVSAL